MKCDICKKRKAVKRGIVDDSDIKYFCKECSENSLCGREGFPFLVAFGPSTKYLSIIREIDRTIKEFDARYKGKPLSDMERGYYTGRRNGLLAAMQCIYTWEREK